MAPAPASRGPYVFEPTATRKRRGIIRRPTGFRVIEPRNAASAVVLDVRRIVLVLWNVIKWGLFPLAEYVPFSPYRRLSIAVRLRRMLEELGLTYLKLGQFLALRYDILPPEICRELNQLFESVGPMSFEQARTIVESELGGPIEKLFASFNEGPIAAASVAQVHEARTRDGERVAVKIQRAGLAPIFRADIRNLHRLAGLAEALGLFGRLSARGMVKQFEAWTLRELDFRTEGRTSERVHKDAQAWVVIPRVRWDLTTARVLTMEYIDGISASAIRQHRDRGEMERIRSKLPGLELDVAMHNFTVASLWQLFVTGFFHGDPHPGNILFLPENRVAFLDFGIFGELSDQERAAVASQVESLALGDLVGSFRAYARQVSSTEDTDFEKFRKDCLEVLGRWFRALQNPNLPLEERHLAKYTGEMIEVARRNGLRYDLNYLLFWRALNNLNGTLWHVDPNFDVIRELRIFFEEIQPGMHERVLNLLRDQQWQAALADFGRKLPPRAARVLDAGSAREGKRTKVTISLSPRLALAKSTEARWSSMALVGLSSLAVLLTRSGQWSIRLAVCTIVSVFMLATVRRGK